MENISIKKTKQEELEDLLKKKVALEKEQEKEIDLGPKASETDHGLYQDSLKSREAAIQKMKADIKQKEIEAMREKAQKAVEPTMGVDVGKKKAQEMAEKMKKGNLDEQGERMESFLEREYNGSKENIQVSSNAGETKQSSTDEHIGDSKKNYSKEKKDVQQDDKKKIWEARNFEDLFKVLKEIKNVNGSNGEIYSDEDIIDVIKRLRGGDEKINIDYVTRGGGIDIRGKVVELLNEEKKEKDKNEQNLKEDRANNNEKEKGVKEHPEDKIKIGSDLKSWEGFKERYKEHKAFIEGDESYFDSDGNWIYLYGFEVGSVEIYDSLLEGRRSIDLDEFDELLKKYKKSIESKQEVNEGIDRKEKSEVDEPKEDGEEKKSESGNEIRTENLPEKYVFEPEIVDENENLQQIRQELEAARKEFLEVDLKKNKAYKRLGKFFGRLFKDKENELLENDQDIAWYRAHYDNKLIDYRNALLKDAKARGASNQELGEIAKTFLVEANLNMAEAHNQVKVEQHEGKAPEFMKQQMLKMSDWYRKLPLGKKIAIGAAFGFGTLAAGATGNALVLGTAVSAATIRRAFLGMVTGTGVALKAEDVTQKRRETKVEKESSEFISQLEGLSAEDAIKLVEERTKGLIYDEDRKIDSIKNKNLRNMGMGVAVGFFSAAIAPKVAGYLMHETSAGQAMSTGVSNIGKYFKDFYSSYLSEGPKNFSNNYGGNFYSLEKGGASHSAEYAKPSGATVENVKPKTGPIGSDASNDYEGRGWKEAQIKKPDLGQTYTENSLKMPKGGYGGVGLETENSLKMDMSKHYAPAFNSVEVAGKGNDSVWKMIDHQLQGRYGNAYSAMSPEQKANIIDTLKNQVAKDPKSFGLKNIDTLKIGQKVDLSRLFGDGQKVHQMFDHAAHLKPEQLENIAKNNKTIADWVKSHPGERLTSPKVEEILRGAKTGATTAHSMPGAAQTTTHSMPSGGTHNAQYLPNEPKVSAKGATEAIKSAKEAVFNIKTPKGYAGALEHYLKTHNMPGNMAHQKAQEISGVTSGVPAEIQPDGGVLLKYPNGDRVFLDPTESKILKVETVGAKITPVASPENFSKGASEKGMYDQAIDFVVGKYKGGLSAVLEKYYEANGMTHEAAAQKAQEAANEYAYGRGIKPEDIVVKKGTEMKMSPDGKILEILNDKALENETGKKSNAILAGVLGFGAVGGAKALEKVGKKERFVSDFLFRHKSDLKFLGDINKEMKRVKGATMEAGEKETRLAELRAQYDSILGETFNSLRKNIIGKSEKIKTLADLENIAADEFIKKNKKENLVEVYRNFSAEFPSIKPKKGENLKNWTRRFAAQIIKETFATQEAYDKAA